MARILVERDVACPTRDGTTLATDVFRPDDGERHPVLLQRTPYDKTFHPFTWAAADPLALAGAGYAVAIQDVRGRYASGGSYDDLYAHEEADGFDAVVLAAAHPGSDGRGGVDGLSYIHASHLLAAPSLAAPR